MSERILVVGAGLAGLSAAAMLSRAGAEVDLVEAVEERAVGASIGITARAVDALAALGVVDECIASGTALPRPVIAAPWGADGEPAGPGAPLELPPREDGLPAAIVIFRPRLAEILAGAVERAGARIRRPRALSAFTEVDSGVQVTFEDGTSETYDGLVAADGVGSAVRTALLGPGHEAVYSGEMSLRWLVRDMPPGQAGFYRSGTEMVAVGLLPGPTSYVASGVDMPERQVDQAEAREMLRGILDAFTAPYLRQLRERLTDDQEIIVSPCRYLSLPTDWHRGRVVLIGDAAHATTPNLSSGGGMALEDGVVLGEEYARAGSLLGALPAFMERRRPRADLVVDSSLELMRLQRVDAASPEAAGVRMRAMAALAQPY